MHLVGFIIRVYHDAWSSECQMHCFIFCFSILIYTILLTVHYKCLIVQYARVKTFLWSISSCVVLTVNILYTLTIFVRSVSIGNTAYHKFTTRIPDMSPNAVFHIF